MRNPTEMMKAILKSERGQTIIDWIAPIYGNSYVGLWIIEAIGVMWDEVWRITEQLRYETTPATTELLIDLWEDHYAIPRDTSLTIEQRRARLIAKATTRGPVNPERLAAAVSAALLGIPCEITENVAKNTFQLNILNAVNDFRRMRDAISVLNRLKPAHLIYNVNVISQVDDTLVKLATVTTHAHEYRLDTKALEMRLEATIESELKIAAATGHAVKVQPGTQVPSYAVEATLDSTINIATGTALAADITPAAERPSFDLSGEIDSNILLATALSHAVDLTPDEIKQVASAVAADFAATEKDS